MGKTRTPYHTKSALLGICRIKINTRYPAAKRLIGAKVQQDDLSADRAIGKAWHGWTLVQQGKLDEGLAEMREGIGIGRMSGADSSLLISLIAFAETLAQTGHMEEAMRLLGEVGIEELNSGGEFNFAEQHRLKGEFLQKQGDAEAEAETCFQQAIESARRIEANSWELRAALSLCRLWQRQGKPDAAYKGKIDFKKNQLIREGMYLSNEESVSVLQIL